MGVDPVILLSPQLMEGSTQEHQVNGHRWGMKKDSSVEVAWNELDPKVMEKCSTWRAPNKPNQISLSGSKNVKSIYWTGIRGAKRKPQSPSPLGLASTWIFNDHTAGKQLLSCPTSLCTPETNLRCFFFETLQSLIYMYAKYNLIVYMHKGRSGHLYCKMCG